MLGWKCGYNSLHGQLPHSLESVSAAKQKALEQLSILHILQSQCFSRIYFFHCGTHYYFLIITVHTEHYIVLIVGMYLLLFPKFSGRDPNTHSRLTVKANPGFLERLGNTAVGTAFGIGLFFLSIYLLFSNEVRTCSPDANSHVTMLSETIVIRLTRCFLCSHCVCVQGRVLQTASSLDEGLSLVLPLGSSPSLDLHNNDQLVHLSAQLQTSQVDSFLFLFVSFPVLAIVLDTTFRSCIQHKPAAAAGVPPVS